MEGISRLPRDCLSLVLALTSPRDSCRSAAVSTAFLSAAASDAVWERFLPPDLVAILSRAVDPPSFTSRRELYFHLCHHPILIDGGRKVVSLFFLFFIFRTTTGPHSSHRKSVSISSQSFWLERKTGAKCYEVGARDLSISWSNDPRYWGWHLVPESTSRALHSTSKLYSNTIHTNVNYTTSKLYLNTIFALCIVHDAEIVFEYDFETIYYI
ncbi:F-box protein [Apostasia shenzhenica]|uniref:F-box protein n=1 Tax=Apostasia shenzhenica TaxID=1088818 RepID=A0A2I0ACW4_9ASPA|nr:F-box protein [Apostasia shenzhenica]